MIGENKKVKNAQQISFEGIDFKSKLESRCYQLLKEEGFNPEYEPVKYILLPPSELKLGKVYSPRKKLLVQNKTCRILSYTPDFEFRCKDLHIYYDVKGKANDSYPIKKKLFLAHLEQMGEPYIFFEPHNIAQIKQSISIIYELCK